MKLPLPHSYWVLPGKLLAGEYPRNKDERSSREKIAVLLGAGVKAFIDLTEADEGLLPYAPLLMGASHERFPIRDARYRRQRLCRAVARGGPVGVSPLV